MKYNELQVEGKKNRKRVGRGISAGQGKTAGRGTKGQGARTGKKFGSTFQGGERSLVRAIPKARGFKSLHAKAQVVYIDHLNDLKGAVDNAKLFEAGLIADVHQAVKVIARGELTAKIELKVAGASKSVRTAIEKAGGSFEKTAVPLKPSTKPAKESKKADK